ncbi:Thyrotropin-releasing hormone-degrading ectoenzyme [Tupaia chinensis]|uniref:Thyrotropin-releasing hormone-degrading ectoenzyme n=1 Tax=Tupaia chinensis TaxID=246437 RepID=L9KZQ1_TUPCH|nr:Thyrotropin-releasing hormone-degrading ectoenzyme [Tupaia chinensis]
MALAGERGEQEEEKKKKKKKKKRKKKKEEEAGAQKSSSPFAAAMGEDDAALRAGGRGLSDPWADSVGVRPRTTERHIAVHKAFAVSIVALLAVTMLAPLHYNLMLTAFMENFTFSGEVNVEISCRNATRYVVLHASRVAVEKVQVAEDRAAGAVPVAGFFLYPQTQVLVVVLNRTLDAQRNYNLKIIYNALIENELLGFFRSSYVLHAERRYGGRRCRAAPPGRTARAAGPRTPGDPASYTRETRRGGKVARAERDPPVSLG